MPLFFLIMAQATGVAVPREETALTIPPPCEAARSHNDEIVVCARREDGSSPYRINQPPARQPDVPKAEVQLADGVNVSAETEQADVGGLPSNRVMVRLKFKF